MNINEPILRRLFQHMITGKQKKIYSEEYNLNNVITAHLFCNLFYCRWMYLLNNNIPSTALGDSGACESEPEGCECHSETRKWSTALCINLRSVTGLWLSQKRAWMRCNRGSHCMHVFFKCTNKEVHIVIVSIILFYWHSYLHPMLMYHIYSYVLQTSDISPVFQVALVRIGEFRSLNNSPHHMRCGNCDRDCKPSTICDLGTT